MRPLLWLFHSLNNKDTALLEVETVVCEAASTFYDKSYHSLYNIIFNVNAPVQKVTSKASSTQLVPLPDSW